MFVRLHDCVVVTSRTAHDTRIYTLNDYQKKKTQYRSCTTYRACVCLNTCVSSVQDFRVVRPPGRHFLSLSVRMFSPLYDPTGGNRLIRFGFSSVACTRTTSSETRTLSRRTGAYYAYDRRTGATIDGGRKIIVLSER